MSDKGEIRMFKVDEDTKTLTLDWTQGVQIREEKKNQFYGFYVVKKMAIHKNTLYCINNDNANCIEILDLSKFDK